MGGTVYDYGDESQFGVVYKKEYLKELSEKDVVPPTLYPSKKEEFLNSLKVNTTNKEQDPFPSDEDISKKMDISDKLYYFSYKFILLSVYYSRKIQALLEYIFFVQNYLDFVQKNSFYYNYFYYIYYYYVVYSPTLESYFRRFLNRTLYDS